MLIEGRFRIFLSTYIIKLFRCYSMHYLPGLEPYNAWSIGKLVDGQSQLFSCFHDSKLLPQYLHCNFPSIAACLGCGGLLLCLLQLPSVQRLVLVLGWWWPCCGSFTAVASLLVFRVQSSDNILDSNICSQVRFDI